MAAVGSTVCTDTLFRRPDFVAGNAVTIGWLLLLLTTLVEVNALVTMASIGLGITRQSVASDNQRHVKYVPAGESS